MLKAASRARFGFLVHDLSRMRRTYFDQTLRPHGITRAQWWALGNLTRHADEGMIQTELAKVLETGKVSVGGLIDRLEGAGLVYRKNDETDRRVKRIFITEQGFALLERIAIVGNHLDHEMFKDIADDDLAAAIGVMSQVKVNLRRALHGAPPEGLSKDADDVADAGPFRSSADEKPPPRPRRRRAT